ncbi:MAG: hypothetical protein D6675_03610 [Gemmatimonadetes bacterium]|nr:MAG: hypothetical protein D6675_03610 [Gemmatimonadota bacterium]
MIPFQPMQINYAEIHYRFPFFFSYLKTDEPEILADAPFRVEPAKPIPILVLIKDADHYPVELVEIRAELHVNKRPPIVHLLEINPQPVRDHFWYQLVYLPRPIEHGVVEVDVQFQYRCQGRLRTCQNDNYRTASHRPLHIFLADEPLPALPDWHHGDIHYHSAFTEDQVEFGAPLPATAQLAAALGLHWFAVTDHSYDLDDQPGDYLQNDPNLPKWHNFQTDVQRWNAQPKMPLIIPGEEVSCGNSRGQNVHLLALNTRQFIPGQGDSAEVWLKTQPDLTIPEVCDRITQDGGLAFGAHVGEKAPFLQRLLLGRGDWTLADARCPSLRGVQIWNGRDFHAGVKLWVDLLLAGVKAIAVGGNDAHGNFNRYRQIRIPFFQLAEADYQKFGDVRTVVYTPTLNLEAVMNSLKQGCCLVTNGPFAILNIIDGQGKHHGLGETVQTLPDHLYGHARSTREFGVITRIRLIKGDLTHQKEIIWQEWTPGVYEWDNTIPLPDFQGDYLRLEVISSTPATSFYGFTNPIWFDRP